MVITLELELVFQDGLQFGDLIEYTLDISGLGIHNDLHMVLIVHLYLELLVQILEHTSPFWPVSVQTCCFCILVSLFKLYFIFGELSLLVLSDGAELVVLP